MSSKDCYLVEIYYLILLLVLMLNVFLNSVPKIRQCWGHKLVNGLQMTKRSQCINNMYLKTKLSGRRSVMETLPPLRMEVWGESIILYVY